MSAGTQNALVLAVAAVAVLGCAYYYVAAVLDQDRALSRAAALAFFVFSVVTVVYFWRVW